MLNDLDPYHHHPHRFLSTFMTLVDFGSFIDSRALVDHISRTRLVQLYRPPWLMRNTRNSYVIFELVKFLRGEEHGSIHAGAFFIQ
jgi:hypothetical protein